MNNRKFIFGFTILLIFGIVCSGCATPGASGTGNTGTETQADEAGPADSYPFITPAKYREMVNIPGAVINGTFSSPSAFLRGRVVTLSPYRIAKYHVTVRFWNEVKGWALANGYTNIPDAMAGFRTGTGSPAYWTAEERGLLPAGASWNQNLVWLNAYSEMNGLEPVYYYQGAVINDANDATACDNAVWDRTKNGYRFHTVAEWEYAARGADIAKADWFFVYSGQQYAEQYTANEENPGKTVLTQGASGPYRVAWWQANAHSINGVTRDTANPDYGIHPVGTKASNRLGIYDMSGNSYDKCWDWYHLPEAGTFINPSGPEVLPNNRTGRDGPDRILAGGCFSSVNTTRVIGRDYAYPTETGMQWGLRLARSVF
jgi:formylglycine-generating enzyme required for sulfatase activity